MLLESRRTLVTGDALATRNPLTGRIGPQLAPDGLNRDSERAIRSLDEVAPLAADLVLPGSRRAMDGRDRRGGPAREARRPILTASRRLSAVLVRVRERLTELDPQACVADRRVAVLFFAAGAALYFDATARALGLDLRRCHGVASAS